MCGARLPTNPHSKDLTMTACGLFRRLLARGLWRQADGDIRPSSEKKGAEIKLRPASCPPRRVFYRYPATIPVKLPDAISRRLRTRLPVSTVPLTEPPPRCL
jgi:hypothetical protein